MTNTENPPDEIRSSVEQAVGTLLKIIDQNNSDSQPKDILSEEGKKIVLTVNFQKIKTFKESNHNKVIKLKLPHDVYADTTRICLFVKDLVRKRSDNDLTIHHYKELLDSQNIKCIDEVMPLHQLRTEFKPHEARRNLCHSYDLFLTDSRIAAFLPSLIGKEFWITKRLPQKVEMTRKDLKQQFDQILRSSFLYLNGKGSTSTVAVAQMSLGTEKIIENIVEAISQLPSKIPGGWANIRGLHVKTKTSLSIPIYVAIGGPNNIDLEDTEEDEEEEWEDLSTRLNTKVRVKLNGDVSVYKNHEKPDGDDDEDEDEPEDILEILPPRPKKRRWTVKRPDKVTRKGKGAQKHKRKGDVFKEGDVRHAKRTKKA